MVEVETKQNNALQLQGLTSKNIKHYFIYKTL